MATTNATQLEESEDGYLEDDVAPALDEATRFNKRAIPRTESTSTANSRATKRGKVSATTEYNADMSEWPMVVVQDNGKRLRLPPHLADPNVPQPGDGKDSRRTRRGHVTKWHNLRDKFLANNNRNPSSQQMNTATTRRARVHNRAVAPAPADNEIEDNAATVEEELQALRDQVTAKDQELDTLRDQVTAKDQELDTLREEVQALRLQQHDHAPREESANQYYDHKYFAALETVEIADAGRLIDDIGFVLRSVNATIAEEEAELAADQLRKQIRTRGLQDLREFATKLKHNVDLCVDAVIGRSSAR